MHNEKRNCILYIDKWITFQYGLGIASPELVLEGQDHKQLIQLHRTISFKYKMLQ